MTQSLKTNSLVDAIPTSEWQPLFPGDPAVVGVAQTRFVPTPLGWYLNECFTSGEAQGVAFRRGDEWQVITPQDRTKRVDDLIDMAVVCGREQGDDSDFILRYEDIAISFQHQNDDPNDTVLVYWYAIDFPEQEVDDYFSDGISLDVRDIPGYRDYEGSAGQTEIIETAKSWLPALTIIASRFGMERAWDIAWIAASIRSQKIKDFVSGS